MSLITTDRFSGIDQRIKLQNGLSVASAMRNYRVTDSGALEKRPMRTPLFMLQDAIDGIWKGRLNGSERLLAACSGRLYDYDRETGYLTVIGVIGSGECCFFEHGGALYMLNGEKYMKYDGVTLSEVAGYIPAVAISCSPDGSGTPFEQLNLLNDSRRQLFNGDGSSNVYYLSEKRVDSVDRVTVDGISESDYTVDTALGAVQFTHTPPGGLNNVEITYSKRTGGRERITNCRRAMKFGGNSDGRIFLWGNAALPSHRFYSDIADGVPSVEYFPVNNFTVIGDSEITCIVQQYDKQLIFTRERAYYSYCELKEDALGNVYSSFPVFSLNGEKGCVLNMCGVVVDNKPVTLCGDGINVWESTGIENEKNAVCISGPIEETVRQALAASDSAIPPKLFDYQSRREMFFVFASTAYVYNYGNGSWYIFDGFGCREFFVYGDELYIAYGKTLYVYSEGEGFGDPSVGCVWQSAFTRLSQPAGRFDVFSFEADVEITGPVKVTFAFEQRGGGAESTRTYEFGYTESGFKRLQMRPHLKRCTPVRVTVSTAGAGRCSLHGLTIKKSEKGRSNKNGL